MSAPADPRVEVRHQRRLYLEAWNCKVHNMRERPAWSRDMALYYLKVVLAERCKASLADGLDRFGYGAYADAVLDAFGC